VQQSQPFFRFIFLSPGVISSSSSQVKMRSKCVNCSFKIPQENSTAKVEN
jgi:hypothetical protein